MNVGYCAAGEPVVVCIAYECLPIARSDFSAEFRLRLKLDLSYPDRLESLSPTETMLYLSMIVLLKQGKK